MLPLSRASGAAGARARVARAGSPTRTGMLRDGTARDQPWSGAFALTAARSGDGGAARVAQIAWLAVAAGRQLEQRERMADHRARARTSPLRRRRARRCAALSTAAAKTPVPAKAAGSAPSRPRGGGVMPGEPFVARDADAVLDISFDQIEIYIFPKHVACSDVIYAQPPYVVVTSTRTARRCCVGKPVAAERRRVRPGRLPPGEGSKYFAIQPAPRSRSRTSTPRRPACGMGA